MALPNSTEKQQEMITVQKEPVAVSRGAVFIKDPNKRRKCPLCYQNLYLYNINFEEMFLMCENSNCDFPFGYEAIQIVQDESELRDNPVKASKEFFEYPTGVARELPATVDSILRAGTCTISSLSCLSDTDQLSQVGDPEDMPLDKNETSAARLARKRISRNEKLEKNKEVKNNLNRIKVLSDEMTKLDNDSKCLNNKVIKNKKYLQKLNEWEQVSGQKLLNDKEKVEFVKNESETHKLSLGPSVSADRSSVNISIVMNINSEIESYVTGNNINMKENDNQQNNVSQEENNEVSKVDANSRQENGNDVQNAVDKENV